MRDRRIENGADLVKADERHAIELTGKAGG